MSKYDPLGKFLKDNGMELIPMSFVEIEEIVGFKLPNSKRYPAWWSNNPKNSVMTKVWLEAGYRTEQVSIKDEKFVFRKVDKTEIDTPALAAIAPDDLSHSRHPAYGCLKGLVSINIGTDLATPADPGWAKRADTLSHLPRSRGPQTPKNDAR